MSSSDFEWGVKNGDLDKVKEAVEKVSSQQANIEAKLECIVNVILIIDPIRVPLLVMRQLAFLCSQVPICEMYVY